MIEEILQAAAPPAAIRKALQEKGVALAFKSIRHALGQLEARKAARQVGNSRTWRYSAAIP
jgi:repressor of nif and glnA expression